MAPVQQLGEVSWSVVCAACCHMALVFAVMYLYNIFYNFVVAYVHSFFNTFSTSGIDKSSEWSTIPAIPAYPSLVCFFNRSDTEGTNSLKKFVFDICVCFVLCKFLSGLICAFWIICGLMTCAHSK